MKKVWYGYCTKNRIHEELNVHKNMKLSPRLASTHVFVTLSSGTVHQYAIINLTFYSFHSYSLKYIQYCWKFQRNVYSVQQNYSRPQNFELLPLKYLLCKVSFTRNYSNIHKSEYLWKMSHTYQRCHSRIGSMAIRYTQTDREPSYLQCRSWYPYIWPQITTLI
jgi:hypothetical protein